MTLDSLPVLGRPVEIARYWTEDGDRVSSKNAGPSREIQPDIGANPALYNYTGTPSPGVG